ncbi:hypothetical protein [Allomuricauda sp. d1]|uniref:hypothetical protein n=1 Tax=Allomuricauda sp. d1 TaxID=3136725 RepID=UPI0031DD79FD
MRGLKSIFDFYLDASIHVALAVVSLYAVTVELSQLNYNGYLMAFIGFSTIVCYNFVKYGVEAEKYLIVSNSYHRIIQVFSFLCFLPIIYCGWHLDMPIWAAIVILTLLSGVYALPVLPQAKNLRSLGILKIFIVALVWMGFTVILPIMDNKIPFTWDVFIVSLQRFLLVLALILPFEIRDMKFDAPQVRTIPQRLGLEKTKRIGYTVLLLFFGFTFLKDEIGTVEIVTRFLVMVTVVFLLKYTKEKQSRYFASFWVEAVPIFWWLLLQVL